MKLIDKEKLLEKLCNMRFEITNHRGGYQYLRDDEKEKYEAIEQMEDIIKDEPIVEDVAYVVRCKDCIFHNGSREGQPNIICFQMKDDDFCSYGERE